MVLLYRTKKEEKRVRTRTENTLAHTFKPLSLGETITVARTALVTKTVRIVNNHNVDKRH